jgi:hypothetical protein
MLTLRVVKWLRLSAGLGLLLLLAAQQKVCPWVFKVTGDKPTESAEAESAPLPTAPDADSDADDARTNKRTLPHLLPDATAPRWPASAHQSTARQVTGARDGVVSCGEREPSRDPRTFGHPACAVVPPWLDLRAAWLERRVPIVTRSTVHRDPALHSAINRTGPPRV